jgi:hypothetical protein
MSFEAEIVEIRYMMGEMRAPGPVADVDKLVAEEIRTIDEWFPRPSSHKFHAGAPILCLFVFLVLPV